MSAVVSFNRRIIVKLEWWVVSTRVSNESARRLQRKRTTKFDVFQDLCLDDLWPMLSTINARVKCNDLAQMRALAGMLGHLLLR